MSPPRRPPPGVRRDRLYRDLFASAITADGSDGGGVDAVGCARAAKYVDWHNPMTYDFFGALRCVPGEGADGPVLAADLLPGRAGRGLHE
ncbi:hypothetical protein QFZ58_006067 [Streptomyces sp. B1I3]|nr:hypothetical protein [Streptomyces sp. B1I3]